MFFGIISQYYLQVCNNILLRSFWSCCTSVILGFILTPVFIKYLNNLDIKQKIRNYGPESHIYKESTPTMGGLVMLLSIVFSVFIWADLKNKFIEILLLVITLFGFIGFWDDYSKVFNKNPEGMSARLKLFMQILFSLIISVILVFAIFDKGFFSSLKITIPFFSSYSFEIGSISFIFLSSLMIVGSSNAVNLTDGLDGLITLPVGTISAALAIISYLVGHKPYADTMLLTYVHDSAEIMIFCFAILGATLAFLWFNSYPAQIFMGDTGSLSLGATLAVIAIMTRQEILFAIMSGVFVIETISVIIQVIWFKYTKRKYGFGKRIFRMTPLHHHFELGGLKENKVVVRFWIVNIILVLVALSLLITK